MGMTDAILIPWYKRHIHSHGTVALLGFQNNKTFQGECYDRALGNWFINDAWDLRKSFDTIICLRCAYFAKNPLGFIQRCYNHLNSGGSLYIDYGFGDHWRYKKFLVGWKKNGQHECAYAPDNFLWSGVWSDEFLKDPNVSRFAHACKALHGYKDLKKAIYDEVPSVATLDEIRKYFNISWHTLWTQRPYLQLYILVCGVRRG